MLRNFEWCINVGATKTTSHRVKTNQFGDGYEQAYTEGINNKQVAWSCSRTGYSSEINAIEQFIDDHHGATPFYMTINGKTDTYRTEGDYDTTHVGGDVWTISFNIKQVFLP